MTARPEAGGPAGDSRDEALFELGQAAGQYPQPADRSENGVTVTTGGSRWLGIRCETCNQTFRRGDRVRISPDFGVQHLSPGLGCASPAPDVAADGAAQSTAAANADTDPADAAAAHAQAGQFTAGLLTAWPPLNGAPVVTLTERHWQVTRPASGPSSPECPGCGHTFRAGDVVIICPCSVAPDDERRTSCQLPVHRDPAAGLACWDNWRPDGKLIRCPRTHQKLAD